MRAMFTVVATLSLALMVQASVAQPLEHGIPQEEPTSPYAGLEAREVKSLSEADIQALQEGRGWGLALPAELNGVPGPAHLLELKDQLRLSADQVHAIEAIHAEMRTEAIAAGERFILAEAALHAAFARGGLDEAHLTHRIHAAEAARAELRLIHLSRHLSTPPLLTDDQMRRYRELRGYAHGACSTDAGSHCH